MESVQIQGDVITAIDSGYGHDFSCETKAIKRPDGVIEILSVDYFREGLRIVGPIGMAEQ